MFMISGEIYIMNVTHFFSSSLIFFGMVVMFFSILKTRELFGFLKFLKSDDKSMISRFLIFHRILMIFFFFGYLVVLISYVFKFAIINELFVSLIFFFGAVFVYISMIIQARFMGKIEVTIGGMLPICCVCKKIRKDDTDPNNPENWESVEEFIASKGESDLKFSHGMCPDCFNGQKKTIAKMRGDQNV